MQSHFPKTIGTTEEMIVFGRMIGEQITGKCLIALVGDLGAGKTHFTKGLSLGLGVCEAVTSPTFSLVQEHHGRLPLYHFDFYRLKEVSELEDIGWFDYLERDGVVIAEWANLFPEVIPPDSHCIEIQHQDTGRLLHYFAT